MNIVDLKQRIVKWLSDYADNAGIDTFVVGVSGGIDSAVVQRLCEATGKKVVCVAMPMEMHSDSNVNSLKLAMELCAGRREGVEFHVRPIGDIVRSYKKSGMGQSELAEGNLRSRIRANILYDFANELGGGLVVGTGNKDEDEIGYFTKGGDGLVDLCPLSLIHKCDVYALAEVLPPIPSGIVSAAPTAGLWDHQTDEDELGMTYDEVRWALQWDETHNFNALKEKDLMSAREQAVLEMVRERKRKNAHKLRYPPIFDPEKD